MIDYILSFGLVSFTMSLIVLLVLAFNALSLKWFQAKLRYAVWLVVLFGLLIPLRPAIGEGIIPLRLPVTEQSQAIIIQDAVQSPPQHFSEPTQVGGLIEAETNETPMPLLMILIIVWAAVAVSVFSYHIWRYLHLIRIVRNWGQVVKDKETLELFHAIKKEKGFRDDEIGLIKCSFVSTSLLTGFTKPMILLPEKYFDKDELEMIFRHELIHYKRKDLLIKLLSVLAISIHWFNPIVYWMCNAIQTESEASCDEAVLYDIGEENRRFYAELIIEMVGSKKTAAMLSTCFYGGKKSLKRRLDSIMDTTKKMRRPAYAAFLFIVLMTAMSGSVFAFSIHDIIDNHDELPLPAVIVETPNSGQNERTHDDINEARAREIALTTVGGGTVVTVLLNKAGYHVDILFGDKKYEVNIDASNGEIIEYHMKPIESSVILEPETTPSPTPGAVLPGLPMEEIAQIAVEAVGNGTIEKIEYDYKNGRSTYEVYVRDSRVKWELKIDGITGDILKMEID